MDINIQILNSGNLEDLIGFCREQAFDLEFRFAKKWKSEQGGRLLVGYMPIYFPRELVHAADGLAVGIMGTGDRKQIIKGDAFYQSYICHIPRGIIELALDGNFNGFDGFIFPSICDVIRNLSGMFKILGIGSFVKYLDYPQNFHTQIGGTFYQNELSIIIDRLKNLNNVEVTADRLNSSIQLFNTNRSLTEEIYNIRRQFPWRLSAEEAYHIIRAGLVLPVEIHNDILKRVLDLISTEIGEPMDKIRVVVTGAFCEQPPVGLIKTIEMAGCYIVDDDFMLGSRWIEGDIDSTSDSPLGALSEAYLAKSRFSPSFYNVTDKGERLVKLAKDCNADGIIFAAPSFCDPALLDQPILQKACDESNLRYISFQYNENTGQFKVIKEQVGAFSDSIKLWEEIPEIV